MYRRFAFFVAFLTLAAPMHAMAQEAAQFGDWRAYCAPVAGCVLGVKSGEGDALAFVEPLSGESEALLVLKNPVADGARIAVSFDGVSTVILGPDTGWSRVDSAVGPAIRIASPIVEADLLEPMRRRNFMGISYAVNDGPQRRVTFSLNGYADTRSYTDAE